MPTIPVKRIQRINKTVPDIDISGIVFTKLKERLIISVSRKSYPTDEDREGLIQKVVDFANNPMFIEKLIDIFNTNENPSNLIWKKDIVLDDIPQTVKDAHYSNMTKNDVPETVKAEIISDSKLI